MNIFFTALMGIILLITPAVAEVNLDKVPKDVIIDGLNTAVVCASIDQYGINRLVEIYNAANADPALGVDVPEKATKEAGALYEALQMEIVVANKMFGTLKSNFDMKPDDIVDLVKPVMDASDEGLKAKLDKFTEFEEFMTAYLESQNTCNAALESFVNKLKETLAKSQD